MDENRVERLRRRIALYRRYLRDGVSGTFAAEYLRQIAEDEAELGRVEPGGRLICINGEHPGLVVECQVTSCEAKK